ncbi:RNA-binding protein [Leptolyngbya sp. 'hensonii']|uniref:Jag family protein n=1 Tax=Leptolyngbya sp. 'hensonii' TaxID=1922337 RepID=UPI00094FF7FD|nr:R3H domain-containing nucleic acid-binding protein [Leptolyngbya sp. 'hensonii']OLP19653.1 RNA-binding protein [Leptolyngbya sp. 'hensonii']
MALPVGVTLEERVDGLTGNKNEEQHPASELHQPSSSSWLTINQASLTPEQITILTGPEGSVLDAMQYLVNTTLNMGQPAEQQHAYTIELNGYRARRQEELQTMAQQAADQVRQTGHEYELKSLSSAERRQVHMFLQSYPDLETYSRGREPDRRLVVRRPQDPAIEP